MVGADADPSLTADEAGQLAMLQIVLVGLEAGAAAALLFASVASGSLLATLLFYLAPLPILIAALGWSHWAGLIASLTAAAGLGATLGLYFFSAFLVGVGLPAWWLSYLALLARPVGANGSMTLEWYPVGRLVLWAAIVGAVLVIIAIPNFGTDKESFEAGLRAAFERAIQIQSRPGSPVSGADRERLFDILVAAIPPAAAVLATLINVFNLWFAGRIVRVSGRLRRPWPDLSALALPSTTLGVLAVAITGIFLPDLPGIVCRIVTASLFMAYAVLGFAVLHALTRGLSFRAILLIGAYSAVIVLGWPVLAASFLGLAEAAFNIRARSGGSRAPPPATTPTS
jgi:Predicted membrane protein (DUF2232)